ncbi:unnamed protein product [Toxocara canis]|uniref:Nsp1_C domain-containing protein n=1 Tax=Toxocara canis TaxID=6265 RepID=A0A183UKU8_TOXCA|nr:unnamed protein product [Toxocara canis]
MKHSGGSYFAPSTTNQFGSTAAPMSTTGTSATATTTANTGLLFGQKPATVTSGETQAATTTAAGPVTPSGFSFGAPATGPNDSDKDKCAIVNSLTAGLQFFDDEVTVMWILSLKLFNASDVTSTQIGRQSHLRSGEADWDQDNYAALWLRRWYKLPFYFILAQTTPMFGSVAPTTSTGGTSIFGKTDKTAASAFPSAASAPTLGSLFGAKPATTTAQVPATTTTAAPTLFGAQATAVATTTSGATFATQPSVTTTVGGGGTLFGAPTGTPSTPSLFSVKPATTTAAPSLTFGTAATATAITTQAPLFGTTTTVSSAMPGGVVTTTTSAVATPSLTFGTSTAAGGTSVSTTTPSSITTALSAPSLLSASKPSAPSTITTTTTSAAAAPLFAVSTSGATTSAAPTMPQSNLAAATAPAAAAITTTKPLLFNELEQLLSRMVLDVESQERVFMNHVLELNAYDRVLRDNQQKIFALSEEVKQLEEDRDRFIHTVDFAAQQQAELETMVAELEKSLGLGDWTDMEPVTLPDPSMATQADAQRQAILQLQLQIDAQVKQADDDINDIVEQVEELKERTQTDDERSPNTVDQIAQILRRQMDSLHWIDEQTEELKKKLLKVSEELMSM